MIDPTLTMPLADEETSQPNVNLLRETAPGYDEEIRELLRHRLQAAAISFGGILLIAFFGNLTLGNYEWWWLRTLFLAAIAWTVYQLWQRDLSLFQLRLCEIGVFGVFFAQLLLMMVARLAAYAEQQDVGSVAAVRYGYLGAFAILILAYGIFVPNRWQRSALVMVPMAIAPYMSFVILAVMNADVATSFGAFRYTSPIPILLMAAGVGVFGSHTIHSVRRMAFKARKFGQYRLGKMLGQGGMGQVFMAEHVLLKRPCAIKLIAPEKDSDIAAIGSFEREVKAAARLTHWNTIEIYDYGRTEDGTFYYVMELLDGMSLAEIVARHGPLSEGRLIYLLMQLCEALQEAHQTGLIHRDIKPANIFVTQLGCQYDVLKLLDFGLVKEQQRDVDQNRNRSGRFSGTPLYMSPEQATAYDAVDPRSDIYALGCIAYFSLAGTPPFVADCLTEVLQAHATQTAPSLRSQGFEVSEPLDCIIQDCLMKDPAQRPQSAADLAERLSRLAQRASWDNHKATQWWQTNAPRSIEQPSDDTMVLDAPTFVLPTLDHDLTS